jgi:phosphoribosyl-ATP pyrophosphohydrolase/phosphoribosyl-AMP cyclohydrolase
VNDREIEGLDWGKQGGLLPAIVQDADSKQVLMLGYMDAPALRATLASGLVTFYSRGKQRLWRKGETSGHALRLVSVVPDCDADALLVVARPLGPTCHRGTQSCFDPDPSKKSAC